MPKTSPDQRHRRYAATQVASTARMLKGLRRTIDGQIELARNLEVDHALALIESGQAKFIDHVEMMQEAKKRLR